jgi:hypothetical protein
LPNNGEIGVSYLGLSVQLPGASTSYELNLVGPSFTISSTGGSGTNPSTLIQNSTTYSLNPFVDNLRDSLSTSYSTNPYNTMGPLPYNWYVYP